MRDDMSREAQMGQLGFFDTEKRLAALSAKGVASRVTPVHTALRNSTRDEGGPFGFGDQESIPSHRKLPRSKAVVVSVAEKSGR
jgi:hypothetical protein